jgi:hypothetical protein
VIVGDGAGVMGVITDSSNKVVWVSMVACAYSGSEGRGESVTLGNKNEKENTLATMVLRVSQLWFTEPHLLGSVKYCMDYSFTVIEML